jgi:hypothetical protein
MTNEQNALTTLTKDAGIAKSWLLQHERLVIVFLLLIISFFAIDKVLGIVASWEQHRATVAEQQVLNDKAKNDVDLAVAKQKLLDYQEVLVQNEKFNAQLQQGIIARDQLLLAQQKKDLTLPPSQLAARWTELVGDNGIQPDASGFTVSDTAARTTVSKLEQVPVLQKDLVDEQSKNANLQEDVTKANDLINQGKTVVSGLQLQLTDQTKACTAEIKAVKAAERKSKWKWFGIGYLAGLSTGVVLHFI